MFFEAIVGDTQQDGLRKMDDRHPMITIAHLELEWASARDFGTYHICPKTPSNAHSDASSRTERLRFGVGFHLHQLSVYRSA